ncbi:MAG: peptidylprolyl isomerase [Chthoniobacterales bacterium]
MKKILTVFLAILCGGCASWKSAPAPTGPEVAVILIRVGKEKQLRRVVLGFNENAAPQTVANFKELVSRKFYNGMRFHRVFPGSIVQTGDPNSKHGDKENTGTGGPGYTIPAEIHLNHNRGSVATARLPDEINPSRASSGSQFYMCLKPQPNLDGKYTVFGEVLEGIDVLEAISNEQTNSNDFPVQKIVIKSITLEPRGS